MTSGPAKRATHCGNWPGRWRVRLRDAVNLALVLLALNLLGRNFGPLSPEWSRTFALWSLVALLPANLRLPLRVRSARGVAGGLALLFGAWLVLDRAEQTVIQLASVAAFVHGAGLVLRGCRSTLRGAGVYAATAVASAAVTLALAAVPRLGDAAVAGAVAWSRFLGRAVVHQPIVAGPAGLGGGVLAMALCYLGVVGVYRWRRAGPRPARFLWIGAALLAAQALFVFLQNQAAVVPQTARPLFFSQAILLGLCLPCLAAVRVPRLSRVVTASARAAPIVALALGLCAAVGLSIWPGRSSVRPPAVFFFDDGFLDWDRPVDGRYGPYASGMFGSLADYLQAAGAQCRFSRELTPERLRGADVLVVINPTNRWADGQLQAVWAFVAGGGALLVLGDHTDIMGSRAVLNALLAPVNLRFNFDSGFPARPEWRDCLASLLHPLTVRAARASDAVISVGASLDLGAPAFTVIRGRYGFSDLGNQLNVPGAFLGDYRYQKGEQLGDVSLVGAAYYGRGKVLVFGDTSPFQNAALAFSFVPFVHPVFAWLTTRDWRGWGAFRWLCALALGSALVILFRCAPAWGGAAGAAAVVTGLVIGLAWERGRIPPPILKGPLALIDRAHANRISLAPLQTDSIGPLTVTLLRNGLLPLMADHWREADLKRASAFVCTAPARRFSSAERGALRDFAAGGGLVLLNAGWEEKGAAVKGLLDEFGFDVLRVPLGSYPVTRADNHLTNQAQFINAWPVVVTDPELQGAFARARDAYRPPVLDASRARQLSQFLNPLLGGRGEAAPQPSPSGAAKATAAEEGVQVLFQTAEGLPLIVARAVGQGSVVLIGDTFFLGNDNLENLQYYRQGNLVFLKHLFQTVRWRRDLK